MALEDTQNSPVISNRGRKGVADRYYRQQPNCKTMGAHPRHGIDKDQAVVYGNAVQTRYGRDICRPNSFLSYIHGKLLYIDSLLFVLFCLFFFVFWGVRKSRMLCVGLL